MPDFNDEYERRVVERLLSDEPNSMPELPSNGGTLTSSDLERLFQEIRPATNKSLTSRGEQK